MLSPLVLISVSLPGKDGLARRRAARSANTRHELVAELLERQCHLGHGAAAFAGAPAIAAASIIAPSAASLRVTGQQCHAGAAAQ